MSCAAEEAVPAPAITHLLVCLIQSHPFCKCAVTVAVHGKLGCVLACMAMLSKRVSIQNVSRLVVFINELQAAGVDHFPWKFNAF